MKNLRNLSLNIEYTITTCLHTKFQLILTIAVLENDEKHKKLKRSLGPELNGKNATIFDSTYMNSFIKSLEKCPPQITRHCNDAFSTSITYVT